MAESKVLWLEVSNVALYQGGATPGIQVQIKGDFNDKQWFEAPGGVEEFKPLLEAMKDKRPIHVRLVGKGGRVKVEEIRITFAASPTRG